MSQKIYKHIITTDVSGIATRIKLETKKRTQPKKRKK